MLESKGVDDRDLEVFECAGVNDRDLEALECEGVNDRAEDDCIDGERCISLSECSLPEPSDDSDIAPE